jgi:hypothetical protein
MKVRNSLSYARFFVTLVSSCVLKVSRHMFSFLSFRGLRNRMEPVKSEQRAKFVVDSSKLALAKNVLAALKEFYFCAGVI